VKVLLYIIGEGVGAVLFDVSGFRERSNGGIVHRATEHTWHCIRRPCSNKKRVPRPIVFYGHSNL